MNRCAINDHIDSFRQRSSKGAWGTVARDDEVVVEWGDRRSVSKAKETG